METESSNLPTPQLVEVVDRLWFVEIIIGLSVLIALNYVFKRVVRHVRQRSLSVRSDWREKLDYIFFLPVHVMLWVLGGILVIEVLGRRFGFLFFDGYLGSFRATAIVSCLAWILLRWKKEAQRFILRENRYAKNIDAAFVRGLGKILSLIVILIAAMIVLQLWGLDVGPLIAFGGIGAAAVGFAGKDVLANFFGGLMLYIARPFVEGDYIILSSQNLEGYVEEIGWYLTSVRDKEKRSVYLPNAIFSNVMVVNSSRMTHRHIAETIGIRYDDFSKIKEVIEEIRHGILAHPQIDSLQPVLVSFTALNQYSLDISIDVYTLATRLDQYRIVKQDLLTLVYEAIQSNGAEMPYPIFSLLGENKVFVNPVGERKS